MKNAILNKTTLLTFFMGIVLAILCLYFSQITPFGKNTLAVMDADIQYLDFFAYFKDVLTNGNNISYSFSKGLGGNSIVVFSYYLSSPLNLLVVFFKSSELQNFFSLIFSLKIALSALFTAIFLNVRFPHLSRVYILILSLSYALMQYNIGQASNIMWLDGVYMLPLILLGIYKLVNFRIISFLAITAGLSVIFNWYVGLINIVFSGFWLLYELALCEEKSLKHILRTFIYYILSIVCALFLAFCLFFPTYLEMQNGRGSIDWNLFNLELINNFFTIVPKFVLGSQSVYGAVSLFCGSLVLIGVLSLFSKENLTQHKKKFFTAIFLLVVLLMFYWQPFIALYSLLKKVDSYWYRYGYLGCMSLVFVSALALKNPINSSKHYLRNAVMFMLVMLGFHYFKGGFPLDRTYLTIIAFSIISLLLYVINKQERQYVFSLLLVLCCSTELVYNFKITTKVKEIKNYTDYVEQHNQFFAELKIADPDIYRISQTKNRLMNDRNMTANYNEGLAFNYYPVVSYTSSPDNNQRQLLDKLGYNIMGDNINVANTSILPTDSLLGVKYVLADISIKGLTSLNKKVFDKVVYQNTNALPLAFNINPSDISASFSSDNPFVNINNVYSYLLGRKVEIFKPVNKDMQVKNNELKVSFKSENANLSYYAYADMKKRMDGKLYVNDKFISDHSNWLAPRVFYIDDLNLSKEQLGFNIKAKDLKQDQIKDVQVYALDLSLFTDVVNEIKGINKAKLDYLEHGKVKLTVAENNTGRLFLTIPYDPNWSIKLNGEEIQAQEIFNDLTLIQTEKNKVNVIEMEYRAKGLYTGWLLTLCGLIMLAWLYRRERNSKY